MSFQISGRPATFGSSRTNGLYDVRCFYNNKPLAFLVVVDGKLQSTKIHYDYDCEPDSNYDAKARVIEANKDLILRLACDFMNSNGIMV